MSKDTAGYAKAYDVKINDVYHPKVRPGFATRVSLWRAANGELMLAIIEKRRALNPSYRPVPLEFYESMGIPIKYQVSFCGGGPDVITESVIMKSDDEGKTWMETGRCYRDSLTGCFAYTSLSDGTILRGFDTSYVSFTCNETPKVGIQKSTDSGKTWSVASIILKNYFGYPYRLKRLKDGALVLCSPYFEGFGPGRPRDTRNTKRPNVRKERQCGIWISRDNGINWEGPLIVLPGIFADEPDFVELPSGDLLFLNSTVQAGPEVRQYVHRAKHGFIPGPVYDVINGRVPETVCVTKSGLLVGARRGGAYTCSNDDGATWHEISGMPRCEYQPMIIELKDGRFLCAWHHGGDCIFGQLHQFVGQHVFRLKENLPSVTTLGLTRDLNNKKTRYINSYTAHLSSGEKGLSKKKIKFRIQARYRDTYDLRQPVPEPQEVCKITDKNGDAHIHLAGFDKEINIHQGYEIKAYFVPSNKEHLSSAESPSYSAYGVTPERGVENNYPLYVAGQKLFVLPEVLESFPKIKEIVEKFSATRRIKVEKIKKELVLSDSRLEKIIKYLDSQNLIRVISPSVFEWKYKITGGVERIEVKDDFV